MLTFRGLTIYPAEVMLCLSLVAVFFPVKIYPLVFLGSTVVFFFDTSFFEIKRWVIFLFIFSLYATISFLIVYDGEMLLFHNILKLLINFSFLYFAISWLSQRENTRLLQMVDYTLHFIFILVAIQLLVYHQATEYKLLSGSTSSGQASQLYVKNVFFWGLNDKNMLGARIAMIGFPFILLSAIRSYKISMYRIVLIFVIAYLSLSRTPIIALLIGCGFLIWISSNKWAKIGMLVALLLISPFLLDKIIRADQLMSSNDGMGIRLVYWKAFFQYFTAIPIWGYGFLKDSEFLSKYADFYRGEHHIHNVFFTNYLQMGLVGLLSYVLFLVYFVRDCVKEVSNYQFWILAFLPLLSIMIILYSGYDNDIVLYLILIFLLGTQRQIQFKSLKTSIL